MKMELDFQATNFITLEDVKMSTHKAPTKEEFLEALKKNGINSLEDLLDAIMPETGGFSQQQYLSEENEDLLTTIGPIKIRFDLQGLQDDNII